MMEHKFKELWDLYAAFGSGSAYYGAQVAGMLDTESIVNIVLGIVLIILGLVRIYYLIKHNGITKG